MFCSRAQSCGRWFSQCFGCSGLRLTVLELLWSQTFETWWRQSNRQQQIQGKKRMCVSCWSCDRTVQDSWQKTQMLKVVYFDASASFVCSGVVKGMLRHTQTHTHTHAHPSVAGNLFMNCCHPSIKLGVLFGDLACEKNARNSACSGVDSWTWLMPSPLRSQGLAYLFNWICCPSIFCALTKRRLQKQKKRGVCQENVAQSWLPRVPLILCKKKRCCFVPQISQSAIWSPGAVPLLWCWRNAVMLLHVFTEVMLGELQSDIYSQTCEDTGGCRGAAVCPASLWVWRAELPGYTSCGWRHILVAAGLSPAGHFHRRCHK